MVAAVMASSIICACGNQAPQNASAAGTSAANAAEAVSDTSGDGNISIVTTIFPEYDWVKNIVGENPANAEITMLLDNGVDLHSYQPTAQDIMKISTCDLFIYVGGESDEWVEDALKEAMNKDMKVINLLDVLGEKVKEEEIVEGIEDAAAHRGILSDRTGGNDGLLLRRNSLLRHDEFLLPQYSPCSPIIWAILLEPTTRVTLTMAFIRPMAEA